MADPNGVASFPAHPQSGPFGKNFLLVPSVNLLCSDSIESLDRVGPMIELPNKARYGPERENVVLSKGHIKG